MNCKDRDQISSEEKKSSSSPWQVLYFRCLLPWTDSYIWSFPKSHLIKQLRSDMNTLCHIQRTPGKPEGVEIDVVQELKFAIISVQLTNPDCKNVTVKFCGDGTSVASNTGMCLLSFSIWSTDFNVSKSACRHIIAVVKGEESYELYKASFKNVFVSINSLFSSKSVTKF